MEYYFSAPHLVMDLILNTNNEKTGLIIDVDKHLFIERLMRRGHFFHGDHFLETDLAGQ